MSQPLSAKLDRIATRHAAGVGDELRGGRRARHDRPAIHLRPSHRPQPRNPRRQAGHPGTRIPVEVILEYLAHNPDFGELFADYPRLTMDDVKASLEYAQRLVRAEATPTPR